MPEETLGCASCGMTYEKCREQIRERRYYPANEQTCCVDCAYLFTHSGLSA